MKKYSKQQVYDFCDAYSQAKQEGLVNDTDLSKFFDKFLVSLHTIGTLVRENQYTKWTRKASPSFHTWLTYDNLSEEFILDSRRDDEWSTELVDKCLSYYEKAKIENWIVFIKTEEYAESISVVSKYYKGSGGYFRHYINRVDRGVKLDEHSYNRFVNNKYASKVLTAYRATPIFPVGSLVDFRAHNGTDVRKATAKTEGGGLIYKKAPQGMLVLSNTECIISACKGAKRYKVVCIGESVPFWIEERYLKKRKKKR